MALVGTGPLVALGAFEPRLTEALTTHADTVGIGAVPHAADHRAVVADESRVTLTATLDAHTVARAVIWARPVLAVLTGVSCTAIAGTVLADAAEGAIAGTGELDGGNHLAAVHAVPSTFADTGVLSAAAVIGAVVRTWYFGDLARTFRTSPVWQTATHAVNAVTALVAVVFACGDVTGSASPSRLAVASSVRRTLATPGAVVGAGLLRAVKSLELGVAVADSITADPFSAAIVGADFD